MIWNSVYNNSKTDVSKLQWLLTFFLLLDLYPTKKYLGLKISIVFKLDLIQRKDHGNSEAVMTTQ